MAIESVKGVVPQTHAYARGYTAGQKVGQGVKNTRIQLLKKREAVQKGGGARARRGGFTATGEEQSPQELRKSAKAMAVKGGLTLLLLVAGIAVVKDLIDIFSALLDAAGAGLSLTVVGAPVGVGLIALSEIIDKVAGLCIDFTLIAYFWYIGGGFALRLVIISIGAIIDAVPALDILPLTTLTFFAAYLFGRAAKKIVQFADSKLGKVVGGAGRLGMKILKRVA